MPRSKAGSVRIHPLTWTLSDQEVPVIFTLRDNRLQRVYGGVITEVVKNGVKHIVADNLEVYVSHSVLNLYTGVEDELWLTADQHRDYKGNQRSFPQLHERALKISEIGVRDTEQVLGWTLPAVSVEVFEDKGGHWWAVMDLMSDVKPYADPDTGETRFVRPRVHHLGDKKALWWGGLNSLTRLTLCTPEIVDEIKALGMWGYYFPEGGARTNIDVARAECEALRDVQVVFEREKLEVRIKDLEGQMKTATDLLQVQLTQAEARAEKAEVRAKKAELRLEDALELRARGLKRIAELENEAVRLGLLNPGRPFDLEMV